MRDHFFPSSYFWSCESRYNELQLKKKWIHERRFTFEIKSRSMSKSMYRRRKIWQSWLFLWWTSKPLNKPPPHKPTAERACPPRFFFCVFRRCWTEVFGCMSSPKPPLLLRPCVVRSPTELHMKRLKLWKRAHIWFSPLHGFARGRQDRSGGFLDLFWAETAEVESSSYGYRSAWRETRRVKIGLWIVLAPARSTTLARST